MRDPLGDFDQQFPPEKSTAPDQPVPDTPGEDEIPPDSADQVPIQEALPEAAEPAVPVPGTPPLRDPLADFDKQFPPEKTVVADQPASEAITADAGSAGTTLTPAAHQAAPGGAPPPPDEPNAEAPVSPSPDNPPPEGIVKPTEIADVAVVFVHGMGTSKPGGTLEQFLNPSLEWIKRATTHDHHLYGSNNIDANLAEGVNILERDRGTIPVQLRPGEDPVAPLADGIDISTIRRAILQSAKTTPMIFVPPYVDAELHKQEGGKMGPTKRLVAVEAWWDGEFEAPAFKDVAYWALGVAPCFILRHLALLWEKEDGEDCDSISAAMPGQSATKPGFWRSRLPVARRFAMAIPGTIIYGLVAVLLQWIICLLLVFGSVPFLRRYVSAIIFKMTSSFGDVLVYVHDGVRSAAIRSTVERTFQWLYNNYQVQRLIVVGYSLGSVISYDLINNRNLAGMVGDGQITYVTLGSPLKKANILLELKRDEQRISLGIPFAFASLIAAAIALWRLITADTRVPATFEGWLATASIAAGTLALGMGAHARPMRSLLNHALSLAQIFGTIAGLLGIAVVTLQLADRAWWILPMGAISGVALLGSMSRVAVSRTFNDHLINRMSPFLAPGWILLIPVVATWWFDMLDLAVAALLVSLIFSVMTGSNPMEEFEAPQDSSGRKAYVRRSPRFAFATPVKKWVDFWGRHDLVAEFGLGDVWYKPSSHAPGGFNLQPNSRRVTNLNMYTHDHTTYQSNFEQFIAPLTRLFLEELDLRAVVNTTSESYGPVRDALGYMPVTGDYDRDVTRAMRTRSSRMRWFNWASMLLMATMMLFAPSIYRSIGEAIIFDVDFSPKTASYVLTSRGQSIGSSIDPLGSILADAGADTSATPPEWFSRVYRANALTCSQCVRHLPVVPEDMTEAVISNGFIRSMIVFGLGYGIVFAISSFLRNTFLLAPWKIWESSLLDSILQRQVPKPGLFGAIGRNRMLRAAIFAMFALGVVALAIGIHVGWFGTDWLRDNGFTPLQTLVRLVNWILPPGWELQTFIRWLLPSQLEFEV